MKFQEKNFIIKKITSNKGRNRCEKYILVYSLGFFNLELKNKNTKKRVSFSSREEAKKTIKQLIFKTIKIGVSLNFRLHIYI